MGSSVKQKNTASLSIIVPVLNEAHQLPAFLDHLQYWQEKGHEIIVVDGGSNDESPHLAVARGFNVISAHQGRARQMNAGAQVACGEILLFLHADTQLPQQADVLIQDALSASGKVWGRFDVRLEGHHWMLPIIAFLMNLRSCLTGIATGDQAIFVSADKFNNIGGFADLLLMEDIQLSKDLLQISRPVCLSQKATTSGRRWLDKGIWRTIWLMWRLRWAYWRGVPADILSEHYQ